ncbi:MAG: BREX-1 system phosphatase PglZ type B [Desulfuromusa sp.]|nr:BREX-1 system phosphatase PglZ type B [Desulfuromusa sp.]
MVLVINKLSRSILSASVFNPEVQVAPACILWPDHDRQWEAVIPLLQAELSELFVLGDYAPEKQIGPAIWLRCVIAGQIEGINLPADRTPIIYLPGVSRQDLRAVEACPDRLKPLAELQYRGTIWSQINAKDWTILAFLKSDQGGLGLDVAQDNATKNAMQLALHRLLDEEITLLRGKRLDKNFFNTLLTGGDPVRDLLQWLDQGDRFKDNREVNEWQAFADVCKTQFAFDPENDGQLVGGAKLAGHDGPWKAVWDRYCEAPKRYPQISSLLRKCQTPAFDLFTNAETAGGWPQWNDEQEASLRNDLLALGKLPSHEARNKIIELEKIHADRRELVWAELGEAPLARALESLALLAETTRQSLAAGTLADMAAGYRSQGWQADDALLSALAQVENEQDLAIISSTIRSLYLPWAEESACYLQEIWKNYPPMKVHGLDSGPTPDCVVFVDGLRFDCARRLMSLLEQQGLTVDAVERWAALPSVTGTGKPAVAPLIRENVIAEEPEPYNFAPLTPHQFKKSLNNNGWNILGKKEVVPAPDSLDPARLWVECGDLDHEGHDRGWKLARQMDLLLREIQERITVLVEAGWSKIRIVTDHGWLLLPGGLPKTDLPSSVAETKWGRCAVIKPGASSSGLEIPWHWNPNQHFALADGISCFRNGEEYTHGGISLQECLTLELTVTGNQESCSSSVVSITDVVWKGLRCTIAVADNFAGLSLDIRMQPGNPDSSVVVGVKTLKENGTASVVVEDEELEGSAATLVLIDGNGKLVAQAATVIGGGGK